MDPQLKVLKIRAEGRLAGHDAEELAIRERTGCSVVAVERGDELLLELGADFRFEPQDAVYVCGPVDAVRRFAEEFGGA